MATGSDPNREFRLKAMREIAANLDRVRAARAIERRKVFLVSYPRSGNTLVRRYFSLLQGRALGSAYEGDVVDEARVPLTAALAQVEIVKSHRLPPGREDAIYLLRDGRNATLSLLYMMYLFRGHDISRLNEVTAGLKQVDSEEGSWGEHVAAALAGSAERRMLFVRYEDMIRDPAGEIARMADFAGAAAAGGISSEVLATCVARERESTSYVDNPTNGHLFEPEPGSIYDVLKRHRREDYWRLIFDAEARRYFHERGGTAALLRFGYEASADWWRER